MYTHTHTQAKLNIDHTFYILHKETSTLFHDNTWKMTFFKEKQNEYTIHHHNID